MPVPDLQPPNQLIQRIEVAPTPFPTRVELAIEASRYLLKTATSFAELRQAFALRHEVFVQEGLGRRLPDQLEMDAYDLASDHLLVFDRSSDRVVGNYRLRCSLFHQRFVSEEEFALGEFLNSTTAVKVEIGRACVHPAYRDGSVIRWLWRGLGEYLRRTAARYVFGCCSVPLSVPRWAEAVWHTLVVTEKVNPTLRVFPHVPYRLRSQFSQVVPLPSLLSSYLHFGSTVLGPPAFDTAFQCADFLTLLDVHDLPPRRRRWWSLE